MYLREFIIDSINKKSRDEDCILGIKARKIKGLRQCNYGKLTNITSSDRIRVKILKQK